MAATAPQRMMAAGEVRVIKPEQHTLQTTQTSGFVRHQIATSPGAWVGTVRTPAKGASGWHHHGDYDTYIFVQSGRARMEYGRAGKDSCEVGAGDVIFVPKGAVHREINPGETENLALLVRIGTGEPAFNVDGPAD